MEARLPLLIRGDWAAKIGEVVILWLLTVIKKTME